MGRSDSRAQRAGIIPCLSSQNFIRLRKCMSSEHFGRLAWQFKRTFDPGQASRPRQRTTVVKVTSYLGRGFARFPGDAGGDGRGRDHTRCADSRPAPVYWTTRIEVKILALSKFLNTRLAAYPLWSGRRVPGSHLSWWRPDCVAGHVRFELRKARADSQDPSRIA